MVGDYEEMAANVVEAAREFVRRSLVATTIAHDELAKKCAEQAETIQSLERRASRHAEHLSRLETRLQAIEKSGK